jgi:hypothetical protein
MWKCFQPFLSVLISDSMGSCVILIVHSSLPGIMAGMVPGRAALLQDERAPPDRAREDNGRDAPMDGPFAPCDRAHGTASPGTLTSLGLLPAHAGPAAHPPAIQRRGCHVLARWQGAPAVPFTEETVMSKQGSGLSDEAVRDFARWLREIGEGRTGFSFCGVWFSIGVPSQGDHVANANALAIVSNRIKAHLRTFPGFHEKLFEVERTTGHTRPASPVPVATSCYAATISPW